MEEPLADDAVDHFRAHLAERFGSLQVAFDTLDGKGRGEISLVEMTASLDRAGISVAAASGGMDLPKLFRLLDTDGGGMISYYEMMITTTAMRQAAMQTRRGGNRVEDAVDRFRFFFVTHYGSAEAAFDELDRDYNGELSLKELGDALKRIKVTSRDACGVKNLKTMFNMMAFGDVKELTFWHMFLSTKEDRLKQRKPPKKFMRKNLSTPEDSEQPTPIKPKELTLTAEEEEAEKIEKEKYKVGEGSAWMKKITELAANVTVAELDLRHVCIGQAGAYWLSKAITKAGVTRQMKLMNLTGNYLGGDGALKIVAALESHCHLKRLLLAWNGIADDGAAGLANLCKKMYTLTELDLGHNHISDIGAFSFAAVFKEQKKAISLMTLNLATNLIGNAGVEQLLQFSTHHFKTSPKSLKIILEENLQTLPHMVPTPYLQATWSQYAVLPLLDAAVQKRIERQQENNRVSKFQGEMRQSAREGEKFGRVSKDSTGSIPIIVTNETERADWSLPILQGDHSRPQSKLRTRSSASRTSSIATPVVAGLRMQRLGTAQAKHLANNLIDHVPGSGAAAPSWPAQSRLTRAVSAARLSGGNSLELGEKKLKKRTARERIATMTAIAEKASDPWAAW